jgi:aspartate/methionine/tyrosine aminotransferase
MNIFDVIKPSLESRYSLLASKLKKKKNYISLGLGEPNFPTSNKIIRSANLAMINGYTRYSSPFGLEELRKKISIKLNQENKLRTSPEQIIVTAGAKMALNLVLSVILEERDEIIIIDPSYPSYKNQILIAQPKAKIRILNLSKVDFSINLQKLNDLTNKKTKAIIFNYPHSPTGKILGISELKKLINFLYKKNFWIISDEVYEKLNFSNKKHYSFGSFKKIQKKVITINSFSKAFSMTGWRIGYLHANKDLIKKMSKIQQHTLNNVPSFIQKAGITALSKNDKDINKFNSLLNKNFKYLSQSIKKSKNLDLIDSEGGLFSFIRIKNIKGVKSEKFSLLFLNKFKVFTTPGVFFGKEWDDHIRVSLSCNEILFKKAIDRLIKFSDNYEKN